MARMRIKDIAQEAGVSPATVSRYLNNRPGQMTEDTKARIAAVIERTGYRPRSAARNLRSDHSRLLGVILADGSNPYSGTMMEELSRAAGQKGYSLLASISGNDTQRERDAIGRLMEAGVEGLVINTCGGLDEHIASVASQVPVVMLDRPCTKGDIDLITSDNARLMDGLVEELHQAGCTSCCLVTEAGDGSAPRLERIEAFHIGAARRGMKGAMLEISCEDEPAVSEAVRIHVLAQGAERGIAQGLIAVNGLVFLRLIGAIDALNAEAAASMCIATFDEYPWNRVVNGGVTTAAQDTVGIANAVVERLVMRIEHAVAPASFKALRLEVPGTVVRRRSTMAQRLARA